MSEERTDTTAEPAQTGSARVGTARTESHDPDFPERFLAFMRQGWRDTELPVTPRPEVPNYAKRRAALSAAFPGETLVIPTDRKSVV